MKCNQGKFIKLFALLLFGFAAVNIGFKSLDDDAVNCESKTNSVYFTSNDAALTALPDAMLHVSDDNRAAEPLDRVFQLIFILFVISPPLIVLMLFLIWRELKARNEMK